MEDRSPTPDSSGSLLMKTALFAGAAQRPWKLQRRLAKMRAFEKATSVWPDRVLKMVQGAGYMVEGESIKVARKWQNSYIYGN